MRWQKKLNKAELTHLRKDANVRTLAELKETRAGQKALDPAKEVCWDCRRIAIKLGIEV